MNTTSQELAQKLKAFNDTLIGLVTAASDEVWQRPCDSEKWGFGVVARHVAASHYRILGLAKLMVAGQPLPEVKEQAILAGNEAHAIKHAACTKEEVLAIVQTNGRGVVDYVGGLSEADLERSADIAAFGGKITVRQLFETIILESGSGHLQSLRQTLSRK